MLEMGSFIKGKIDLNEVGVCTSFFFGLNVSCCESVLPGVCVDD